jgi:hypothetical protein
VLGAVDDDSHDDEDQEVTRVRFREIICRVGNRRVLANAILALVDGRLRELRKLQGVEVCCRIAVETESGRIIFCVCLEV